MQNKFKIIIAITICTLALFMFKSNAESWSDFIYPPKKTRQFYEKNQSIIWELTTKEKVIALTFDDGPNEKFTPLVLDLLKKNKVKATFFLIGEHVNKFPSLAKKTLSQGHEIGNHTFTHPNLRITSPTKLRDEITKTNEVLKSTLGFDSKFFRPSGGIYNDSIVNIAKRANQTIVLWSWDQDTEDWKSPTVSSIVNRVVNHASNGDIVLFHDSQKETVSALKIIIPKLKKQGYKFVTISELIKIKKNENR